MCHGEKLSEPNILHWQLKDEDAAPKQEASGLNAFLCIKPWAPVT